MKVIDVRSFHRLVQRCTRLRRALDAEMKDATSHGLNLKYKGVFLSANPKTDF